MTQHFALGIFYYWYHSLFNFATIIVMHIIKNFHIDYDGVMGRPYHRQHKILVCECLSVYLAALFLAMFFIIIFYYVCTTPILI